MGGGIYLRTRVCWLLDWIFWGAKSYAQFTQLHIFSRKFGDLRATRKHITHICNFTHSRTRDAGLLHNLQEAEAISLTNIVAASNELAHRRNDTPTTWSWSLSLLCKCAKCVCMRVIVLTCTAAECLPHVGDDGDDADRDDTGNDDVNGRNLTTPTMGTTTTTMLY